MASEALFAHAVKKLTARPHTRAELTASLTRLCFKRKVSKRESLRIEYAGVDCRRAVAGAMSNLDEAGLTDDLAYSAWHTQQRAQFRPRSILQLRSELYSRGVVPAHSAASLAAYDELQAAVKLASKLTKLDDAELCKKLRNKGFPVSLALAAISRARSTDDGTAVDTDDDDDHH